MYQNHESLASATSPPDFVDPSSRTAGLRASRSPNRWTTPLNSKPARPPHLPKKLFHFLMSRMLATRAAKLFRLQPLGAFLLALRGCGAVALALTALDCS